MRWKKKCSSYIKHTFKKVYGTFLSINNFYTDRLLSETQESQPSFLPKKFKMLYRVRENPNLEHNPTRILHKMHSVHSSTRPSSTQGSWASVNTKGPVPQGTQSLVNPHSSPPPAHSPNLRTQASGALEVCRSSSHPRTVTSCSDAFILVFACPRLKCLLF